MYLLLKQLFCFSGGHIWTWFVNSKNQHEDIFNSTDPSVSKIWGFGAHSIMQKVCTKLNFKRNGVRQKYHSWERYGKFLKQHKFFGFFETMSCELFVTIIFRSLMLIKDNLEVQELESQSSPSVRWIQTIVSNNLLLYPNNIWMNPCLRYWNRPLKIFAI